MANDVLNSLNTQMIQAMDKAGITLGRLMRQLSDELQAKDTKFFADKGIIKDTAEVVAHDVRQRARIDAHKLRGDYPAEKREITGKNGGPIEHEHTIHKELAERLEDME